MVVHAISLHNGLKDPQHEMICLGNLIPVNWIQNLSFQLQSKHPVVERSCPLCLALTGVFRSLSVIPGKNSHKPLNSDFQNGHKGESMGDRRLDPLQCL